MNYSTKLLLHLNLIQGIGPAAIARLIVMKKIDESLYDYSVADLVALGIRQESAQKIVDGLQDHTMLNEELALLDKHGIQVVTCLDADYPALLREIAAPPIVLYYRGSLPNQQCLAMIGARKADSYAREVAHYLIPDLVAHDWTIVSGGALGADTFAHEATLAAKGKTIVVLGSGLLQLYPSTNKKLFERIVAEGGCVMSAFPVRMEPLPHNFPARNRIISGLSRGCIVLQAAVKSGAAITAQCALEQGRDVFAVPGLLSNPLSAGCHALIQAGAKLVQSPLDILEEYGQAERFDERNEQQSLLKIKNVDPFWQACQDGASMEDLMALTGASFEELSLKLFSLQLEGKISQNHAGLWKAS